MNSYERAERQRRRNIRMTVVGQILKELDILLIILMIGGGLAWAMIPNMSNIALDTSNEVVLDSAPHVMNFQIPFESQEWKDQAQHSDERKGIHRHGPSN
jgi:hypothetical protein